MKRTTLQIEPALVAELKRQAAAEGRTLTERLERALRLGLAAEAAGRRSRVRLPSYDLGPFLADPNDRAAWPAAPPAPSEEER
ncbi:MAG: ribbon-helix-helix protein, CopG family [Candidatus Eiseniibacteriota bacterium]